MYRASAQRTLLRSAQETRRCASQVHRVQRVLDVKPEVMYEVVADVDKYQQFVPYCLESTVTTSHADVTTAMLRVGWNNLDEYFESTVTLGPDTVTASAVNNSMFKELRCEWLVKPARETQCLAYLKLRFQFQNALYNAITSKLGPVISQKMIGAFCARAQALKANRD